MSYLEMVRQMVGAKSKSVLLSQPFEEGSGKANAPLDSSSLGYELNELNELRVQAVSGLLGRLQAGTRWLTYQHEQWQNQDPTAASDERFSAALDLWGAMEQTVRQVFGYEGCVLGPSASCPDDAPVRCDGCIGVGDSG